MSDDPEQIRAAARQVRSLSDRARDEAQHITHQSAVQWTGSASETYRRRLADRAREFTTAAGDLDDLAKALLTHAKHVEDHERAISAAAQALPGVPGAVSDLVGAAEDVMGFLS